MVAGLLVFDVIVLSIWQIYDPLQRSVQVFPLELPASTEYDIKIRPELEHGEGTSDSAYGGGTSVQTRSSRASASDIEFSESYL